MYRTCEECGRRYNDIEFSTVCPHDHIDGNYCREHDLFDCRVCKEESTKAEAK